MTRILEEAGIPVIHDTTLNDYPSYNGSYDRTRENIERYLEQYPSIQMVIDVHRDAVELLEGGQMATSATVNGKPSAQVMLVMGTDEGGLTHPNWQDNLSWALKPRWRWSGNTQASPAPCPCARSAIISMPPGLCTGGDWHRRGIPPKSYPGQ